MDIHKIIINQLVDSAVVGDKFSKTQAPRAPVPTNLANYKFSFRLGLFQGLVDLFHLVDTFVVNLLWGGLCGCC